MALTEIEYGSLASSEVMNNNFEYLDNKISDVSGNLSSNVATINANIATVNSSISTMGDNLNKSIETTFEKSKQIIADNALFVTTYRNGTSWCREYFSDAAKTNRVWLEQGFFTPIEGWGDNNCKTYNLVKAFKENNYTVVVSSTCGFIMNGVSSGNVNVEWTSTTQIGIGNDAGNTFGVRVYACGY